MEALAIAILACLVGGWLLCLAGFVLQDVTDLSWPIFTLGRLALYALFPLTIWLVILAIA